VRRRRRPAADHRGPGTHRAAWPGGDLAGGHRRGAGLAFDHLAATLDDAADGITLVDTVHNKLYLVASDGRGSCLCSQSLGSVELKDGLPVVISASFATPPPEMTEIQVQIPNFGVFPHVPIG